MEKRNYFPVGLSAKFILISFFTFYIFGTIAKSQSCDSVACHCESNDLNPSGIMIGHSHPKNTWMFSYRFMGMSMDGLQSSTKTISDEQVFQNYIMSPSKMNMQMHMLMAMYGISSKLSVMAMFNYNMMEMHMNMLAGSTHVHSGGNHSHGHTSSTDMHMHSSGLGDTKIIANYSAYNKKQSLCLVSLGFNIPTGSIQIKGSSEDAMYPNSRYPYMMQMGSGSLDVLQTLTYQYMINKLTVGAQANGTIRLHDNAIGYRLGNEYAVTSWLGYELMDWLSISTRIEGISTQAIYKKDPNLYTIMEPAAKNSNYGGQRMNGYLGLNIFIRKLAHSKIGIEYGMPLYENVNGIQLSTHNQLFVGWTITL